MLTWFFFSLLALFRWDWVESPDRSRRDLVHVRRSPSWPGLHHPPGRCAEWPRRSTCHHHTVHWYRVKTQTHPSPSLLLSVHASLTVRSRHSISQPRCGLWRTSGWSTLPRILYCWRGTRHPVPLDTFFDGRMKEVRRGALWNRSEVRSSVRVTRCVLFPDPGSAQSLTLPDTTSSFRVTSLRLGRRYRFGVQPVFYEYPGPETDVEGRTGDTLLFSPSTCPASGSCWRGGSFLSDDWYELMHWLSGWLIQIINPTLAPWKKLRLHKFKSFVLGYRQTKNCLRNFQIAFIEADAENVLQTEISEKYCTWKVLWGAFDPQLK